MPSKQSAAKPQARKRTSTPTPKPPAAPQIVVEAVDDAEFEGRYLGAFVARLGRVKSDVRSTPEKAEADLQAKLASGE